MPLICVLGSFQPADVARLLECGADDVLVRDTDRGELRPRIDAHIRRAEAGRDAAQPAAFAGPRQKREPEGFGGVIVDSMAREVKVNGRPVRLGRLEFEPVEYLSRNAGVAVSWDQVCSQLYGPDAEVPLERLEILVRRGRAKLAAGGDPTNLVAVPGWGYRWDRRRRPCIRRESVLADRSKMLGAAALPPEPVTGNRGQPLVGFELAADAADEHVDPLGRVARPVAIDVL